jgi:glycosyltransferase involved in cell wall biosynthesis
MSDAPKEPAPFEIACCIAMEDSQVFHHLAPLAMHPMVTRLWIIRTHASATGKIPKVRYVLTPEVRRPARWIRMLRECRRIAARPEVRAFVSFNPFPYGLIGAAAARRQGKPVHFGFIGSDWYRHMKGPQGRLLRPLVQNASFYTCTGEEMRTDMVHDGFDGGRVASLPHCVDLERFDVREPDRADYTCIFVGKLIERKRVDVILHAFAEVLRTHPNETLCILGRGPLEAECRALAGTLGIESAVDFAGFHDNVEEYYGRARIDLIASHTEGYPFSLVEGICCGLVPVSTPAGTIADHIRDGENGLLVPIGDAPAMANAIRRLLDEPALYERLRGEALKMRDDYSYERATEVWDSWLRRMT